MGVEDFSGSALVSEELVRVLDGHSRLGLVGHMCLPQWTGSCSYEAGFERDGELPLVICTVLERTRVKRDESGVAAMFQDETTVLSEGC